QRLGQDAQVLESPLLINRPSQVHDRATVPREPPGVKGRQTPKGVTGNVMEELGLMPALFFLGHHAPRGRNSDRVCCTFSSISGRAGQVFFGSMWGRIE